MTNPKPSRKRWKIALGVVVLFAVVGWLVAWPAYQRHLAIAEIERVGGYAFPTPTAPSWMRRWGYYRRRHTVYLEDKPFTDSGLSRIDGLANLKYLYMQGTEVSDEGVKHLTTLRHLYDLSLARTQITGDGLRRLVDIPSLRKLRLEGTAVTDKGLQHLVGLEKLIYLNLSDTLVTEDGVKMLQESLPNCRIDVVAQRF